MAQQGYILSQSDVRVMRDLLRVVQSLGGAENLRRLIAPAPEQDIGLRLRLARVTAATATATVDANGNAVTHSYTIEAVAKVKAGITNASNTGVWQSLGANYTYTGVYQLIDDGNDGTGRQIYGINHDGALVDGKDQAKQPLQVGTIVLYTFIPVTTAAGVLTVEPWIVGTWATIDGTCDAA